jgi:hypothetical protein
MAMSDEHSDLVRTRDAGLDTYDAFGEARGELLHTLAGLAEVDRALGLDEAAASLDELAHKVGAGVFRVLVLGEFKRGKSTLINAMLGVPILPANVTPTTALLTVVRYGETPAAAVHHHAGNLRREVPLDDLRNVLVLSSDEVDNRRRQSEIKLVEVLYPAALCRNNVELVDSPGLNEHTGRTELTTGYIRQCDAALFVLSATNFGSLTEGAFLTEHLLGKGLRHIFFAVNQFDRVLADADDPEREARSLRALARARLGPLCQVDGHDLSDERIHFVSARQALRARRAGDDVALRESGVPQLEEALESFLSRDRGRVMLVRPLTLARGALAAAGEAVTFRRRTLALDLEVLEERARRVEPEFAALQERRARILAAIETMHAHTAAALELSLRRRTGELADRLRDAVEAFTIDAGWNPSAVRAELVSQINDYLHRELSRWAEAMAAEVQGDLERLLAEIGDDAAGIDASLRRIRLQVLEGEEEVMPAGKGADPYDILEDILSAGGGRFLSDFDILLGGAPGWLGSAVRVIAFQIAAGALVAALGLTAGPLVAISTAVGAAILALISRRGAIERSVRERVAEAARPEIARIPERALPAMLGQVEELFTGLATAVASGIDVMVDNLRATIAAALAERRARESELEPDVRRLALAEERLAALGAELDALAARLA